MADTQPTAASRSRLTIGLATGFGLAAAGLLLARGLRSRDEDVGYPPFDQPKPLAENIWIVDGRPISAMGLALPIRMTVIRLASGDLLLHSPIRHTPDLAQALAALGPIRHFVAPATGHWTFLEEWQQAYPDATAWAVPVLRDRPQVRRSGVRIDAVLGDSAPAYWGAGLRQGLVRGGGGFEEAWLFHEPSRTLILTDLLQNLDPRKLPPLTALLMRAAGATAATTARHVRAALRANAEAARQGIRALIATQPETVVLAHGDVIRGRGAERVRQGFAWLA